MSQSMKALQAMLTEGISLTEASARFGVSKAAVSKAKLHPSKKRVAAQTIEQLTARVRELEEENKHLRSAVALQESSLLQQLAATQLREEQLRGALDKCADKFKFYAAHHAAKHDWEKSEANQDMQHMCNKALAIPNDTSALDAYVAKRLHDMACDKGLLRIQVEELTRQRDLAVEALKWLKMIFTDSEMSQERNPELWMPTVEEAIKESEWKHG